jgi:hypothetical protein
MKRRKGGLAAKGQRDPAGNKAFGNRNAGNASGNRNQFNNGPLPGMAGMFGTCGGIVCPHSHDRHGRKGIFQ